MNYKNKRQFKHHSLTKLALLLVTFTLFFSNLSAQNGGEDSDTITVKKPEFPPVTERTNEPEIFVVVEIMPEFPGGQAAMAKYIADSLVYPVSAVQNGIQGRVVVQFVVDTNGEISHVKVVSRPLGWGLDEAAVKVVANMPNWTPGKQRGKPVLVRFVLPIRFQLEADQPTKK